jgi:hypothetical protein
MGWMESKLFLAGRSADLCERILRARQEQEARTLHDPIEDDPKFRHTIAAVREKAETIVRDEISKRNERLIASGRDREVREWPLGSCHRIWRIMKEQLQELGIQWYSLADMNPGHHFD